jgi:asparagine synthase (glutamine-hydrolysing)
MSENDATLTDCEAITADIKHYMMLKDAGRYMVDDILFKVDRASMTYSLEARVPIIDHRVVELAWQMPLDVKYRNGQSKWPLRQVLEKHVPKSIYDAPKQGFDVPISKWLRHELKDWAEGLIYSESLRNNEYIKFEPVDKFWREHQSRKYDRGANLWTILLFLNWQKLI